MTTKKELIAIKFTHNINDGNQYTHHEREAVMLARNIMLEEHIGSLFCDGFTKDVADNKNHTVRAYSHVPSAVFRWPLDILSKNLLHIAMTLPFPVGFCPTEDDNYHPLDMIEKEIFPHGRDKSMYSPEKYRDKVQTVESFRKFVRARGESALYEIPKIRERYLAKRDGSIRKNIKKHGGYNNILLVGYLHPLKGYENSFYFQEVTLQKDNRLTGFLSSNLEDQVNSFCEEFGFKNEVDFR
ncbi:MAG: hypothetical protein KC535_02575 [Nanoarchaeota archaeon]|nr:hypothetical protein [Nanoarchaeota archaeon]